jgi:hypothetical protein
MLLMIVFSFLLQSTTRDYKIKSTHLEEDRIYRVHLPDTYDRDKSESYPVVYVLDGEYVFDYAKGRIDFVSNGFGHLPKMIVVGIPNTDRAKDFYFSLDIKSKSIPFLNFMAEELMPKINTTYRTNGFDILYGWSSASNMNITSLVLNPNLFDAHILSGSGIGNNGKAYLETLLPHVKFQQTFLFVSTESPGPRVPYLERFESVINSIKPDGLSYAFEKIEGEHVDNLASGFDAGIRFIFDGFYIPRSDLKKGYDHIIKYYQKLNSNYAVDFTIPEGAIVEMVSMMLGMKMDDDIVKLLDHGLKLHPNSVELYGTYGEFLSYREKFKDAKSMFEKALSVSTSETNKLRFTALVKSLEK